jgi:NADH:ubiquinone reductase (H+-translocating)
MERHTAETRLPETGTNGSVSPATVPHVVIVGGGFGGLAAARKLADQEVRVTVIDRTNYHLFQPMLYQVATTMLAPGDVATPIRDILRTQENATVLMAEVTGVDTHQQLVLMGENAPIHYDYLILATGAGTNYFGHLEWERIAPGMKTLDDAITLKNDILSALEAAEREPDEEKRKPLLTLVLVGGGPTGVELAAMLVESIRRFRRRNFQRVNARDIRIVLVDGGERLISSFHPVLSSKVLRRLLTRGVEIHLGAQVKAVNDGGVMLGDEFLAAENVIWVAGVKASPASAWLQAETDHGGRVKVQADLSVAGHPNIFVIGDTACVQQRGKTLPGIAEPALQGGHYVAAVIADRLAGKQHPKPFKYFDEGSLAIVGHTYAIFERWPLRLVGGLAWLMWLFVHIYFLIGVRNRLVVFARYAWAYLNPFEQSPGARIIFIEQPLRSFDEEGSRGQTASPGPGVASRVP